MKRRMCVGNMKRGYSIHMISLTFYFRFFFHRMIEVTHDVSHIKEDTTTFYFRVIEVILMYVSHIEVEVTHGFFPH